MRQHHYFIAAILTFFNTVHAAQEILFLGLHEDGSPSLSRTFDKLLRSQLESTTEVSLTDNIKTLQYCEDMSFSRYATVSTDLLAGLQNVLPDSILVMWGQIVASEIKPVRKHLFGCELKGSLTVGLTIYNITAKQFLYSGNITSEFAKCTSPVFFSAPEKVVHISSKQRALINDALLNKVAFSSTSLLISLIRNHQSKNVQEQIPEEKASNVPSISDVFSVPSVEPPKIEDSDLEIQKNETKKNTSTTKTK